MLLYNSPLAGCSAIDERLDKYKRAGMTQARMERSARSAHHKGARMEQTEMCTWQEWSDMGRRESVRINWGWNSLFIKHGFTWIECLLPFVLTAKGAKIAKTLLP